MKILHLVDPGESGGGASTLRYVADLILHRGGDECVMVLGHREHARLAQRCGLNVDAVVAVPRSAMWPSRGLRLLADDLIREHGRPDVVHAWSLRGGRLAGQLVRDTPVVVNAMVGPEPATPIARCASALSARVNRPAVTTMLAPHDGVAHSLLFAGLDERDVHIAAPGVDLRLLELHRQPARKALRRAWGIDDESLLVGLISQPVAWSNARTAASIVTLPVTAHRDVKLLVHPDAMRLQEAYEWARPLMLDHCLIQEPDLAEPWRVLAGLDVALWIGNRRRQHDSSDPIAQSRQPAPCMLPIVWAMAAGVPVMAERCAASESVITHGENGLLIDPEGVTTGAKLMIALFDDPALRRDLGQAAQQTIASKFTIAHAARRIDDVYRKLIGTPSSQRSSASAAPEYRMSSTSSGMR